MTIYESDPSDEQILTAGGWDPRFARVLAKALVGDRRAVVIIDSNGADGGALYPDLGIITKSRDGTWKEEISGSAGFPPEGICSSGWAAGVAYAYGVAGDQAEVRLDIDGAFQNVPVQRLGWWLFARDQPQDVLIRTRVV
jgi:hypothetical protein